MKKRSNGFIERLSEAAHALDVPISEGGYDLLARHHRLVQELEERRGVKLLPYSVMEELVAKTFGSLLVASKEVSIPKGGRILDATEQACIPGIVHRALDSDAQVVVLTPSPSEAALLDWTIRQLEVENIEVTPLWLDSGSPELGEFDVIFAPGDMPPEQLLPMVSPFRKQTGTVVVWGAEQDIDRLGKMAEGALLEMQTIDNPLSQMVQSVGSGTVIEEGGAQEQQVIIFRPMPMTP